MTMDDRIVEAVARAIYDAPLEISGGDTIAEIVHSCEWINDAQPLETQLEQVREVCGELARAAITAYQAEAWQPIETAPKDGTPLLGWSNEGVAYVCWWSGRSWAFFQNARGDRWSFEPTHWQPLPPAPKASP